MAASFFKKIPLFLVLLAGLQSVAYSDSEEVQLMLTETDSGSLYVHASLGADLETDMLIDTGSSYVTLSKATFAAVEANTTVTFSRDIYAAMADGRVSKVPLYLLGELVLSDTCLLKNIEVAVLENGDIDILGMNALKLLQPFTLQMLPAMLSSSGCAS
jgi:predicted aspartyl protease